MPLLLRSRLKKFSPHKVSRSWHILSRDGTRALLVMIKRNAVYELFGFSDDALANSSPMTIFDIIDTPRKFEQMSIEDVYDRFGVKGLELKTARGTWPCAIFFFFFFCSSYYLELSAACARRSLPKSGTKAAQIKRLVPALDERKKMREVCTPREHTCFYSV